MKTARPPHRLFVKYLIVPSWLFISMAVVCVISAALIGSNGQVLGIADISPVEYRVFAAMPKKPSNVTLQIKYKDVRVQKLSEFFAYYNAPQEMIAAAPDFVAAADAQSIPWTLLPAISCKESGCGRAIPIASYNPFGWGVWTGQQTGVVFSSFSDAAYRVAAGLRKDYFNKGFDTVAEIETKYTPPSATTHKEWQRDVNYFMDRIENWQL